MRLKTLCKGNNFHGRSLNLLLACTMLTRLNPCISLYIFLSFLILFFLSSSCYLSHFTSIITSFILFCSQLTLSNKRVNFSILIVSIHLDKKIISLLFSCKIKYCNYFLTLIVLKMLLMLDI